MIIWYTDWQITVDQVDWLGTGHYISPGKLEDFSHNKIYLIPPIRFCSILKITMWSLQNAPPPPPFFITLYTLLVMTDHPFTPPWKPCDPSKMLHPLPPSILPLYTLLAMTDHPSTPPWKPYDSSKMLHPLPPSILPLYTLLVMTDHLSNPPWKPYDSSKFPHPLPPLYITPLYSVGNDWSPLQSPLK